MRSDSGSFRDPSGGVFVENGEIRRSIFGPGVANYTAAKKSGIFERLIKKNFLISHEEISPGQNGFPEGTVICLSHPRLPMVSYPWEWTFSMLKDAAKLHLEAMEELIPNGFWLRDASAFNVQFDGKRLLLIDTLSVGQRLAGNPWPAYRQFCSHFVAPLALAACEDIRMLSLWRNYIDGYPLDLAVRLLKWRALYRPRLWMHLTLHASFQRHADTKPDIAGNRWMKTPKVTDRGLIGLIRSLKRTIGGLAWRDGESLWKSYGKIRTYTSEDVGIKHEFVSSVLSRVGPRMVWDLGANTGEFSELAASHGSFVVSVDSDAACTELIYRKLTIGRGLSILPLTMDLANPSPSLGWESNERLGLSERGPADLTLALALIHHIVLASCVPLERVACWFARLSKHLLIEYVPLDDPRVKKLLRHRSEGHLPYNEEAFHGAFHASFDFLNEKVLPNGRRLYFCRRKASK